MGGIRSTYIQYLTKPKAYRQILEVSPGAGDGGGPVGVYRGWLGEEG